MSIEPTMPAHAGLSDSDAAELADYARRRVANMLGAAGHATTEHGADLAVAVLTAALVGQPDWTREALSAVLAAAVQHLALGQDPHAQQLRRECADLRTAAGTARSEAFAEAAAMVERAGRDATCSSSDTKRTVQAFATAVAAGLNVSAKIAIKESTR